MHNDKIGHGAQTQAAHRGFEDGMALSKFTLADIRRSSCPKHFKDESCGDCPILYECSRCYAVPNPCLGCPCLRRQELVELDSPQNSYWAFYDYLPRKDWHSLNR